MRRITPQEVKQGYGETDLKPCRKSLFRPEIPAACALGMLLIQKQGPITFGDSSLKIGLYLGLSKAYTLGFLLGFDGLYQEDALDLEDEDDYLLGCRDGQDCAAAVFSQ